MRKGVKNTFLVLLCAFSFGVLGIVAYQFTSQDEQAAIALGGPFELVHHSGKTVTDENYRGRYLLVYFGFTNCPAICPTSLLQMTNILERLEGVDASKAEQVTPLFISVDPQRDTLEVIANYISHFHDRFEGLTGTVEQLQEVARSYGSYFSYVSTGEAADDYTVNHSSFLYLIGPEGRYVTHFSTGQSNEDIVAQIAKKLNIS